MTVALTGSVGSGKSTVGSFWRDAGVPVVSADDLARQVVAVGSPGLAAVVEAFGADLLAEGGELRRDRLRAVVFSDEAKRRRLESILHPRIASLREDWVRQRRDEAVPLAVAEVPLLFELDLEDDFDLSVVILASRETCLRRLRETRGISVEEGARIWDSQLDPGEKEARADFVVWNDGGLDDLRQQALSLLDLLRSRARRGPGP
jgi:dephospho-CoA kinase